MSKNKIAVLFLFLLLFTLLLSSCSDSPSPTLYSYKDADGGVIIEAVTVRARELCIPESYHGKPVVGIADNAFYRSEDLRKVTIPSSVRKIGINAFGDCEKLNTLVFESGGECTISEEAFSGCVLLNKVKTNGSIVAIGERAFMNCKRIFSFEAGDELTEIGYDAFMGCEQMLFKAPEGSYASEYAEENHLITDFFDTDTFFYIQITGAVVLAVVLLLLLKVLSKKRKKHQKST